MPYGYGSNPWDSTDEDYEEEETAFWDAVDRAYERKCERERITTREREDA